MPKAIRYDQPGGPEVMKWVDVEVGEPKAGEVRIRQHAVGLNYIDVYFRTGLYPQPLPGGLGMEAAGEVTAVGDGVSALKAGDRVAYVGQPPGAYAQERVMPAERLVKLPDAIGYDDAASVMLQGLTAHYLLRRTYPVKAGDTILIHAAAGGVGLLVCQWAKALGATVIGTVGSDEKAALASAHGCDHPIVYTRENFTRVKEITNGAGVPVVYDSIGKDTYIGSLDCLAPLGYFVSFGNASGPLPPIDSKEFVARLAVLHAPDAVLVHREARRSRSRGRRAVRRDPVGQGEDQHQPALSARGSRPRARPRVAQDHRLDRPRAVTPRLRAGAAPARSVATPAAASVRPPAPLRFPRSRAPAISPLLRGRSPRAAFTRFYTAPITVLYARSHKVLVVRLRRRRTQKWMGFSSAHWCCSPR
jgi:NADPH2:quinone reductase